MRCPKNTAKPPIAFYRFSFTMKARSVRNRPARMLAELMETTFASAIAQAKVPYRAE